MRVSYLFCVVPLSSRERDYLINLRDVPAGWRQRAASLPCGEEFRLPSGAYLIAMHDGPERMIPPGDYEALRKECN